LQNISLLQGSFAKETNSFKEATNRSHPILRIGKGAKAEMLKSQIAAEFSCKKDCST